MGLEIILPTIRICGCNLAGSGKITDSIENELRMRGKNPENLCYTSMENSKTCPKCKKVTMIVHLKEMK